MRKLFMLLIVFCLLFAFAAADDVSLSDAIKAEVEAQIAQMAASSTGWSAHILSGAVVESVTPPADSEGAWTINVSWPSVNRGTPKAEEPGDDALDFLRRAFAPYIEGNVRKTTVLKATAEQTASGVNLTWGKNYGIQRLKSAAKSAGTSAASSLSTGKMRTALTHYLCERVTPLSKSKPDTIPTLGGLMAYGEEIADALGMSAEEAAYRIAPMLLLTDVIKMDISKGPEQAKLTLQWRVWDTATEKGVQHAKEALVDTVGAPAMSRGRIASYFTAGMSKSIINTRYGGKKKTTVITVDLIELVQNGRGTATEMASFLRGWLTDTEPGMTELLAYAKTLNFYQKLDVPAAQLLHGQADASGCLVTFDLGKDTGKNAYLQAYRGGELVWTGLVTGRMHLQVVMQPGDYSFRYGRGEGWYDEQYLFTESGEYGSFELTVPAVDTATVHLEDTAEGTLSITPLSWDEVRAAE